jgi:hypothetical protein
VVPGAGCHIWQAGGVVVVPNLELSEYCYTETLDDQTGLFCWTITFRLLGHLYGRSGRAPSSEQCRGQANDYLAERMRAAA